VGVALYIYSLLGGFATFNLLMRNLDSEKSTELAQCVSLLYDRIEMQTCSIGPQPTTLFYNATSSAEGIRLCHLYSIPFPHPPINVIANIIGFNQLYEIYNYCYMK
jgi:hypothetical protein